MTRITLSAKRLWTGAVGGVVCAALVPLIAGWGCSSKSPPTAAGNTPTYDLTATVQDLMEGQIDPAADALWDSVAFIATDRGTEDRQPRTPEQWQAVRSSALALIEATNLLSMPGRRVAVAGKEPGPGELSPAQIQQRIEANQAAFVQFARVLQAAGHQALAAIDARDAQELMDAGGVIDEACEACHVTYWYPNQSRPAP